MATRRVWTLDKGTKKTHIGFRGNSVSNWGTKGLGRIWKGWVVDSGIGSRSGLGSVKAGRAFVNNIGIRDSRVSKQSLI